MMEHGRIWEFIRANLWRLILGAAGLISAVLVITIGLPKTLLIVGVTAAGCLAGLFIDKPNIAVNLRGHGWLVGLGMVGLVLAVLILTIGFFKTLLIAAFLCAFGGFGFLVDKVGLAGAREVIIRFFRRRH